MSGVPEKSEWSTGSAVDVPYLVKLLYLRAVWKLPVGHGLPDASPVPDRLESIRGDDVVQNRNELAVYWDRDWAAGLTWLDNSEAGLARDPNLDIQVLPREIENGPLFSGAGYQDWSHQVGESIQRVDEFFETPDNKVPGESLKRAWSNGFRLSVVLPFEGLFSRRFGAHTLVLSHQTYLSAESYSQALADSF